MSEHLNTVYVVGEGRTNLDNAITKTFGSFFMAFEIADNTEEIIDFSCTHTVTTTQNFLRKLFIGQKFSEVDSWLEDALEHRYGGSSKKAVLVSYRDALKRFYALQKK